MEVEENHVQTFIFTVPMIKKTFVTQTEMKTLRCIWWKFNSKSNMRSEMQKWRGEEEGKKKTYR